uniref:nuclear transport factor 2A-like isoform X1 n=1 Tax=Erigeron canadensis TaxID=72917 RepID=UPI001CB979F3|nr:nuclear transport factor 2A-like isoform X1 [Erigeron canadensis]
MDPDALSKAFVDHYYSTFDTNRGGLANLYQDASMLTFEGQKIQGSQNIVAKLTSLPFQQCKHTITTVDCQPSGPAGGMLVFVSGNLQLAGEQHALKFSQNHDRWLRFTTVLIRKLALISVPFDANTTRKLLCVQ